MNAKTTAALLAAALAAGCADNATGPSSTLFECAMGDATTAAPGQVLELGGSGGLCIEGDGTGDYVFVPFLSMEGSESSAKRRVDVSAGGITSPSTTSLLGRVDGPRLSRRPMDLAESELPVRDEAFHTALRQREIRELTPRIHAGAAAPVRPRPAAVPAVGDLMSLNTSAACDAPDVRTGRVRAISNRAIVVEDTANPAPGLDAADVDFFAMTFDTLVWDVDATNFGQPSDIDNNQHVIIFFTRAVNERTAPNSDAYIAGFFWAGDLFPKQGNDRLAACASSNEAEMFYMLAPDPDGVVNNNSYSIDFVRRTTVATIGHEFQHLINASRRLFVNNATAFETVWLNEGLSHIAEELIFYEAAGLAPGNNYTVEDLRSTEEIRARANQFLVSNISRYISFLERPDTASAMGDDNLANRGAIWAFLRYAADRSGQADSTFFKGLVDTGATGVTNLRNVIGDDPLSWMNDWAVAVFADDYVAGVNARFTQPSWNFRSVVPALVQDSSFPIDVRPLSGSRSISYNLLPGGVAYPTFGLEDGRRGVVTLNADSKLTRDALRGALLRIR